MLTVTPRAAQAIKNFLEGEGKSERALRIVAQAGCCSGTTHGFFFEKSATPEDDVLQQEGVMIYIDKMSHALLSEAKLDFENGSQGEAFFIDNPLGQQAQSGGCGCNSESGGSCGCGNGSCSCGEQKH